MQLRRFAVLVLLLGAPLATPARAEETADIPEFTEATIETLRVLPVQSDGRVKPFSTYSAYTLLAIHHKRSFALPDGRKIGPDEWWLRTALFPEDAVQQPVIRIEDFEVLQQIGLRKLHETHRKRDVYTYAELSDGLARLREKYRRVAPLEPRQRTRDDNMLLALAHKVFVFESVKDTFAFAEYGVRLGAPVIREQFDGRESVPVVEALTRLQELVESGERPDWGTQLAQVLQQFADVTRGLRLMPPLDAEDGLRADWYSVGDIVDSVLAGDPGARGNIEYLGKLQAIYDARADAKATEAAVLSLAEDARARAESSHAYGNIEFEDTYHRLDIFSKALYVFLLGFLVLGISWLRPGSVWIRRTLWTVAGTGATLIVAGIVMRCILRGRPPVSTLYETILFITGIAVLASLVTEWINKRRIGIAAAVILGALGMFIAGRYELSDRKDTMPQLQAVLDTNFWLATHVTCITIGYAAGLLASAIAHIYVIGKTFRLKRDDPEYYRGLARMVYGTIGFSLVFSVVGTILGGVWANDSWGRFWGWDPKENGALMIVLSQLIIIHGRLGGHLKAFGTSYCAIFSGMIIAFSWWHVNLLGIGLHAYGFTEGIWNALLSFYLLEGLVLLATGGVWLYDRFLAHDSA